MTTKTRIRTRVRRSLAVAAVVGATFAPVAVITASPSAAATKGFENMPPA